LGFLAGDDKVVCTELATLMQLDVVLQIIKSLIKLMGLIAVVYILLPDFKVRPFFDAEYLQNGCSYGHSYYVR